MTPPPNNSRRPSTLVEAARQCQTHLERLGEYAQKSKAEHYTSATKSLLEEVVRHTNGSIGSLETWITEIEKGRQTSDASILKTVNADFVQLEDGIKAAEAALDHRRRLSRFKLRRPAEKLVLGPECCHDALAKMTQGRKQPRS